MKAIIFARVSSKEQEDGQSIPAQIRRLTEYAVKKQFAIDDTSIFQITESSSKETRKQFEQIVALIKKSKEPIALITDTVDRLQRSFRETPMLDELRRQGKLELHFLREGLVVTKDSNSSQLMQWDIGVLFASSYVRQLSDNVKRGQEQCYKDGRWVFKAPYGYRNVTLPSEEKSIEVHDEEKVWVMKAFEYYAQGNNSFSTVADKLIADGFSRKFTKKSGMVRLVELILKNSFYMGMMKVNGELIPHQHPTLISEYLFTRVQEIIANHHKAPYQYAGKLILLRGLISCGQCGGGVCGDIKKGKYVYYSCHNSKRTCVKKFVREEALLDTALTCFDDMFLSDEQINEVVAYIRSSDEQELALSRDVQRQLNKKLSIAQQRISRLVDMHVDGSIDGETYRAKHGEYKREQQELIKQLKGYEKIDNNELSAAEEVLVLAKEAKELFLSSKFEEKQQLLRLIFSNLRLNDGKLDVELRKPFDEICNLKDHTKWSGKRDSNPRPLPWQGNALPIELFPR